MHSTLSKFNSMGETDRTILSAAHRVAISVGLRGKPLTAQHRAAISKGVQHHWQRRKAAQNISNMNPT